MSFNAVQALTEKGHDLGHATEAQLSVIATLSEAEVAVLNSVKERIEGEVTAHVEEPTGVIVW
ncbi:MULTISPECIES: aroma-sacti cluster domain-containing protein [unclassified Streptomyces]|uniref:aroma-sacti cluster domain-containing protein n=1 Tax=unclassified Streptomyces TaxID=2593676 RepID=UPI0036A3ACB3